MNSYRPGFAWTHDLVRGVSTVLENEPHEVAVWAEYMDAANFSPGRFQDELARLYRHKYGEMKFDVVVSTDDDALEFLLKHGEELFGGAPIVFCGVNNPNLAARISRDRYTGVMEIFDNEAMLNAALRLHPGTKQVYFVSGTTATSVAQRELFEQVARRRSDLAFTFLDGRFLSLEEVLAALRKIPEGSLVISASFLRDRTGARFREMESNRRIAAESPVPVYAPLTSALGQGLVAGSENGGYRHGMMAGNMAARILRGEHPSQIPLESDAENRFVFDSQQLTRWGIRESQIPADSIVVNKPVSFYQAHKALLLAGFVFVAFQASVIFGLFANIARRKRAVAEQSRMVAILEATPDFVGIAGRDGRILYLNRAGRGMIGAGEQEDLSQATAAGMCPAWAAALAQAIERRKADQAGIWSGETTLLASDGREIPISQVIITHRDASGGISFLSTIARDITERKRAEESLRASELRFRTLVDNVHAAVAVLGPGATILYANQTAQGVLGCEQSAAVGGTLWDCIEAAFREDGTELPLRETPVALALATGQPVHNQVAGVRLRGSRQITWMMYSAVPVLTPDGSAHQVIVTAVDLTSRKQTEEALADSQRRYQILFESAGDAIFLMRQDRFVDCNQMASTMFGCSREEIIGRSPDHFSPPNQPDGSSSRARASEMIALALKQGTVSFDWQHCRLDGTPFEVHVKLNRVEIQGETYLLPIVRNVTQQKRLEEQLLQAQKIEAVGQLAGGVAHDFNNMLAPILGYSDLLLEGLGKDDPRFSQVEEIRDAARRARDLTQQLLAFARRQSLDVRPVDLNEVIVSFQKMLLHTLREDVEMETRLAPALGMIEADPGQIEQILLNLAINAADAMPLGGTLTIETMPVTRDESYTREHQDVIPGPYIALCVKDTGIGMDKATLEKIFEPFFSTKGIGRGTGLGLSTVHGIVKQHGGHLEVESQPGHGTAFRAYFPRKTAPSRAPAPAAVKESLAAGSETILVVEDQRQVRSMVRGMLTRCGYTVMDASSPMTALELAERHQGTIHLLVSDVVMPEMNGKQLYERMASMRPDLRVIYMSGYPENVIAHHGVLETGVKFIQKPFSLQNFANRVREVLDED